MYFDLAIAARTVWMEARGEGDAGMRAVAWAIVNRHNRGKWFSGKTLAHCCLMPRQFSCWNTDDANRVAMAKLDDDNPALVKCIDYMHEAMLMACADPVKGATHYVNLSIVTPKWAATGTKTVQIGGHTFFKDVE